MQPVTVSKALQEGSRELKNAGLPDSRSEAEILLAFVLGCPRFKLYTRSEDRVPFAEARRYREAVQWRAERCPAAYIKGWKEFYGFKFEVNRNVLIPRPETELLIDTVLEWCRGRGTEKGNGLKIVDLGTGSGAIVITLALLLPRASFWAMDISPGALSVAQKNAALHRVNHRIGFRLGDYWEAFAKENRFFNVVVSNPPYIPRRDMTLLPEDIKNFEPALALDGGEDGMDSYRRILDGVDRFISPPALMVLELGEEVREPVLKFCREKGIFSSMGIIKDLAGKARVIKALF